MDYNEIYKKIQEVNKREFLRRGGCSMFSYKFDNTEEMQKQEEKENAEKIEKAKEFLKMTDEEVEEIKERTNARNNYELACELEKIILDMNKEVEDDRI